MTWAVAEIVKAIIKMGILITSVRTFKIAMFAVIC